MTALLDWFSGPTAESLCLTLLHSLWQGAIWCGLLLVVLRRVSSDWPEVRYVVTLVSLYGLLLGACLTWSILRQPASAQTLSALVPVSAAGESMPPRGEPHEHEMGSVSATGVSTSSVSFELSYLAPWVVSTWLIGACLCLLMSSRHVSAVRRFQAGKLIDDPDVNRLLAKLTATLGISRPVKLLSVEGLSVPGVVGVLKPAILIPSSLVTGLTPDQWEAILAHELAHVRRWDYLVNLSQLVIESVLFFNPAVWWLSRQVRLEREACCDAAAVRVTARPFQYAELLVGLAERLCPTSATVAPAVGFSREQSGSLLERVRRIVTPGWRSELKMNRPVAVSFLVLGLAAVVLLQAGADVAVQVVANMWDDEERVATLVETKEEMGTRESKEEITIRGTLEFEGEKPPRQYVTIHAKTRRGINTAGSTPAHVNLAEISEFDVTVGPGISCLQFGHPDFAETQIGPYGAGDEPVVSGVHVVLRRGIDVPVVIVDEKGQPVPDAQISAFPVNSLGGGGSTYRKTPTTDESGQTVLVHINPDLDYRISVRARGFQTINSVSPTEKLTADSPLRLEMLHAQPASGIIVNQDGEALSGAKVKSVRNHRPGMTNIGGQWVHTPTISDSEGRFALTELEDGWIYDLLVERDGCAPAIISDVHPGDMNLRSELGPALTAQGTVQGPLEELEKMQGGQPVVWELHFPYQTADTSLGRLAIRGRQKLDVVDGVGHFTLSPLAPGELIIEVGTALLRREMTTAVKDLKLDLSVSAKRAVRVSFTRDMEPVSPQGSLQTASSRPGEHGYTLRSYPILDGIVEAEFYTPGQLHFDSQDMVGFWFNSHGHRIDVPTGSEPFEIIIPVRAAGAVKGVVLNANGSPADAHASVTYGIKYATSTGRTSYGGGSGSKTNDQGEFFISPIPFGAKCSIRASQGRFVLVGDAFTMNAKNALPTFRFQRGKGVDAKVRLLDEAGMPLGRRSVALHCRHPKAPQSWGPPEITDRKGECRFLDLNPQLQGYYEVELDAAGGGDPMKVPLELNGETTVIRVTP
jgi:beta-lactamase regulating signal transducer with metallopeptidase domain